MKIKKNIYVLIVIFLKMNYYLNLIFLYINDQYIKIQQEEHEFNLHIAAIMIKFLIFIYH